MNVIDAHHHGWGLAVRDQEWLAEPELAPIRRDFSLADLGPQAPCGAGGVPDPPAGQRSGSCPSDMSR
ncbi:hypothetical protein [Streptomyces sp. G-5]|uniref:hypothetical protein n=1 Tax=Streptomyces sp. G-5 TaxID=2977231 RepID=UPI003977D7DF